MAAGYLRTPYDAMHLPRRYAQPEFNDDMDAISSWQASATPCRLVFATDYGLSIAAVNVTFSVIVQYASDRISSHSV